ncbi:MAG: hypothetical protein ACTSVB_07900 [Candidatus Heimdallarchaeaceae archaeon]
MCYKNYEIKNGVIIDLSDTVEIDGIVYKVDESGYLELYKVKK